MTTKTPALSRLEAIILSALASKEQYGLEMIDTVKERSGQALSLGGLYTTLHRMERKGLVTARWVRPRKFVKGRGGATIR